MTTVVPVYEKSGFALRFSWPHLALGDGNGTRIVKAETGEQTAQAPSWFAGWFDPSVAMVLNDCPGGQRRSLLAVTGEVLNISDDPNRNIGAVASMGSWASNVGGAVRLNGIIIDQHPGNLGIDLQGRWLAHQRNEGPTTEPEWQRWRTHLYSTGQPNRVVKHQVPAHQRSLSTDGRFAYCNSQATWMDDHGTAVNISATQNSGDLAVHLRMGLDGSTLWQFSVVGGEARHVIARKLGETSGYVFAFPWGISNFDAVERPDGWWFAWGNNVGRVGVTRVAMTDGQVEALPVRWPLGTLPSVPPAPKHLKGCGYFFRDTNIYPYVAKYGGRNPAAPGTHSVIVDDHGLPAEGRLDGSRPRMIVGLSQLLHPQMPQWWDRVDAVYVGVENDEAGLERYALMARYLMRELHLAPKPILSYSAGSIFPHALDDDDILGVQLYAERGVDPVASIRSQAASAWPQIQSRKRVAIIGQAYDRNGWFTGAQCAAIQPVLYEIASAWPNCEYLLWFSDARAGGTRDHEEMRPWHVAIADAITRNV